MDPKDENVNPDFNRADQNVSIAIDKAGKVDNEIHLSSGVVLLAKPANPNMLIRAMSAHPRPIPPTHFIKEMGRSMENPDDPDYISRVQAWQMEYSNAMLTVLIMLGTEIKSIPKGMEGPHPKPAKKGEEEKLPDWITEYSILNIPMMPTSPTWRYVAWVQFKAAPTQEDTKKIGDVVKSLSGVKEADVRDAENFPAGN